MKFAGRRGDFLAGRRDAAPVSPDATGRRGTAIAFQSSGGVWTPAIDVEETDKEYLIKADLPDMKKADVKINLEDAASSCAG